MFRSCGGMRRFVIESSFPSPSLTSSFSAATSTLNYLDESLINQQKIDDTNWTRNNAASFLQQSQKVPLISSKPPRDLHHYLKLQGYITDASASTTPPSAFRTISSLLSYPLTLAYSIQNLFPDLNGSSALNVLIIGARSESSLPKEWWLHTLYAQTRVKRLKIDFVGPDLIIPPKSTSTTLSNDENSIKFEWNEGYVEIANVQDKNKIAFHEHTNKLELLRSFDLFVLFNPGFGSKPLQHQWEETLKLLLWTRKPIVATAHGHHDLSRDLDAVKRISGEEDHQGKRESNPYMAMAMVDYTLIFSYHICFGFLFYS